MIVVVIVAGAFKYGGHNPQDASQAYQASALVKDSWKATTPWMHWLLWPSV